MADANAALGMLADHPFVLYAGVYARLVALHRVSGHNLRGLAVAADGKHLLLSHQILDQKAATTRENIEAELQTV